MLARDGRGDARHGPRRRRRAATGSSIAPSGVHVVAGRLGRPHAGEDPRAGRRSCRGANRRGMRHAGAVPTMAARLAAIAAADAVIVADYGRGCSARGDPRAALPARSARPVVWDPHPAERHPVPGAVLVTPNRDEAAALAERPGGDIGEARRRRDSSRRWRPSGRSSPSARAARCCGGAAGAARVVPRSRPRRRTRAAPAIGSRPRWPWHSDSGSSPTRHGGEVPPCKRLSAARAGSHRCALPGPAPLPRQTGTTLSPWPGRRVRPAAPWWPRADASTSCMRATPAPSRRPRRLGDCLVVCLNSDASVRRLKGPERPIMRRTIGATCCWRSNASMPWWSSTRTRPRPPCSRLAPDIWVKGGDYVAAASCPSGGAGRVGRPAP